MGMKVCELYRQAIMQLVSLNLFGGCYSCMADEIFDYNYGISVSIHTLIPALNISLITSGTFSYN